MRIEHGEQPWQLTWSRGVVFALAAGLALRLVFVFGFGYIFGDALVYGDIARNLIEHHVYGLGGSLSSSSGTHSTAPPHPTLLRLPGFPLFLAACFLVFGMERYTAVMLVQTVFDLGTCWLLASLAGRLFRSRKVAIAALWLACLCPFTANYCAAPITECLTIFTTALAFYALAAWLDERRTRWLVVLGCALGYSILLRPEQGLLAAAVVPAVFWMSRKTLRPAIIVSILTLLPLVPWAARNWHTMHVFQPLAPRDAMDPGEVNPDGFDRWYRTWGIDFASTDDVYWQYDGSPINIADLPDRAFASDAEYTQTEALLTEYDENNKPTPGMDARWNALAAERIRANPLRYYIALPAARLLNMMFRPRIENFIIPDRWWKLHSHPSKMLFALAWAAINFAYFALAAWGWLKLRERGPILWSMLAYVLLRAALLLTIDNSEPRYTLEFYPLLIVLAACAISRRTASRQTQTASY